MSLEDRVAKLEAAVLRIEDSLTTIGAALAAKSAAPGIDAARIERALAGASALIDRVSQLERAQDAAGARAIDTAKSAAKAAVQEIVPELAGIIAAPLAEDAARVERDLTARSAATASAASAEARRAADAAAAGLDAAVASLRSASYYYANAEGN